MRYIVTGGAGFIGSNLADILAQNHDVVIIDNLATGRRENIEHLLNHPRVTFIEGSVTGPDLLAGTFPGADGIFLRVAIPLVPRAIRRPSPPGRVGASPGGMDAPTTGPLHGRKVRGMPALFPFPGAHPYEIQVTAGSNPADQSGHKRRRGITHVWRGTSYPAVDA